MKKRKEAETNATEIKKMQHPAIYWGTVIILIVIVIAFVFVPALGGITMKTKSNSLGSFQGKKIPSGYQSYYYSMMAATRSYIENAIPKEQQYYYSSYLLSQAKDSAIQAHSIEIMLLKKGIIASPSRIENELRKSCGDPYLGLNFCIDKRRPVGKANFSSKKYNISRVNNSLGVKNLRKNLATKSTALTFSRDLEDLSQFSDSELKFINEMANETATGKYFTVKEEMINDKEILPFVEKNKDNFIKLSIRALRTEDNKTAKSLLNEFKEDSELFQERAKVYNVGSRAKNGGLVEGFKSEIKSKLNIQKDKNLKIVSNLSAGEISPILNIDGYFYLVKAIKDPEYLEANEIIDRYREKVIEALKQDDSELFRSIFEKTAQDLVEKSKNNFESVANEFNAEVKEMASFSLNYGNSSLLPSINPTQFSNDISFLTDVFSSNKGDVLNPISSGLDLIIFKVTNRKKDEAKKSTAKADQVMQTIIKDYIYSPKNFIETPPEKNS